MLKAQQMPPRTDYRSEEFLRQQRETIVEMRKAHPRAVAEGLYRVQALLNAGRVKDALRLVNSQRYAAPAFDNARAVCLLRLGAPDAAVRILRQLTLVNDGGGFRNNAPLIYKINLATALAITGHVSAAEFILHELRGESHPQLTELRMALARWKTGLSMWELFQWNVGAALHRPVNLHYIPGELG